MVDIVGPAEDPTIDGDESGRQRVDARHGRGLQFGDHNTQINYHYPATWTDGVAPTPLIDIGGVVESPYRGLGWFNETDAPFFFGRDDAIDTILRRLGESVRQPKIFMVSGVSGAGKSSLLRAGVLPRIRGQGLSGAPHAHRWPALVMSPGHQPVDELALRTAQSIGLDATTLRGELRADPTSYAVAAAQAAAGGGQVPAGEDRRLLLVVDQFEQIFTQCSDPGQRRGFLTALHTAATTPPREGAPPPVVLVLVVRSDFEGRCANIPELTDPTQHRYMITAMTEHQVRLAITEPAKKAGSRVEDDLTEQLLRDLRTTHPTGSFSATPSAAVLGAGVLPLLSDALDRAWRSRGGDTLSILDYARTGGIASAVADSAQRAYDALTPTQQDTARRVFTRLTVTDTEGIDTADRVLRADLIPATGEVEDVEAVLEAFASERLLTLGADTVEISHEVLLHTWPLLRDVWLAETRTDRAVITRLRTAATSWGESGGDNAYLYSGSVLDTATATLARITADPHRYPPLNEAERRFLTTSTRAQRRRTRQQQAGISVLIVLVIALTIATVLVVLKNRSETELRKVAVARDLISRSQLFNDTNTDPVASRLTALAAWRLNPTPEARQAMLAAAFDPLTAELPTDATSSVVFNPAGDILATNSDGDGVQLWDPATGEKIRDIPAVGAYSVAFHPRGDILATNSDGDGVQLWDPATGEKIRDIPATFVTSVAFHPRGDILATNSDDDGVQLWNPTTAEKIRDIPVKATDSMAFDPTGDILATSGADEGVQLWDATTSRNIGGIPVTGTTSVAFHPRGDILATNSYDDGVQLWDPTTSRNIGGIPDTGIDSMAFDPTGDILATSGAEGTRLWHSPASRRITRLPPLIYSAPLNPAGDIFATSRYGDGVQLWNPTTGERIRDIPATGTDSRAAFHPMGDILATSGDANVQLWNPATGEKIRDIPAVGAYSVAFDPMGDILAASGDANVQLWNPATGEKIRDIPAVGAYSVAFDP
ncbi:NACHT and WD repeat domain-containing protein, partial [Nocardia fusca]